MAVEHVSTIQQITQNNAQPMSSAGVLQSGIMALMMIMMFTMDGRYQSLFGIARNSLSVVVRGVPEIFAVIMCAFVTVYVCTGSELDPGADKTTQHIYQRVREFWPLLKDPDTLLAVHGMLRCIVLLSVSFRVDTRKCWPVPASFLHFSFISLVAQLYLINVDGFGVAGPFAGCTGPLVWVALYLAFVMAVQHKRQTGERMYPLAMLSVILVSAYVAWTNRLAVAADDGSNALFSFSILMEVSATLHFAIFSCCAVASGEMLDSHADGLVLTMTLQRLTMMYYILDGFGMLPRSTLESIGAIPSTWEAKLTGEGHPMLLIAASNIACVALATLGSVAYFLGRFWNDDKVALAPQARAQGAPMHRHGVHPQAVPAGKLSSIIF